MPTKTEALEAAQKIVDTQGIEITVYRDPIGKIEFPEDKP